MTLDSHFTDNAAIAQMKYLCKTYVAGVNKII